MDSVTHQDWENQFGEADTTSAYSKIETFLQQRIRALKVIEMLGKSGRDSLAATSNWNNRTSYKKQSKLMTTSVNRRYAICTDDNYTCSCPQWTELDSTQRRETALRLHLCVNCLSVGHLKKDCTSKINYQRSQERHHTSRHASADRKRARSNDSAVNVPVSTVRNKAIKIARRRVNFCLEPSQVTLPVKVNALVLRDLGVFTPSQTIVNRNWAHIQGLPLADPEFAVPRPIDVLLGAEIYGLLLLDGLRHGSRDDPVALQTFFGWVLIGPVEISEPLNILDHSINVMALSSHQKDNLAEILKRFWEQEELNIPPMISLENQECERASMAGCRRDNSGRYIVRLPLRTSCIYTLGESLQGAKRILNSVCQRLNKDALLNKEYIRFISDYEKVGHMRLIQPSAISSYGHPKLSIVFNASQRTTSGLALYHPLYTGHKLQNDLASVLIRWRFPSIAFRADIGMMYHQIQVDDRDVDLNRIVCRQPGTKEDSH
ncbi:uncharacterized protein LOC117171058 [Belonocnema kinseyi]|uniref:uncharacterized protein LOC117171058 n=1 Tax=Belonocnema kinseyi TaxID=2817044 RepID=UPI00143DC965|nr:uncharacterized protein LOC117171058 [Belonocnema kinseyi]